MEIKYFGMIAEATGSDHERLDEREISLKSLKGKLEGKYPRLQELNYKFAVNQAIVSDEETLVSADDEIALLPPFAGG